MMLKCCDFNELEERIKKNNLSIVMFGAGAIGQVTAPEILNRYDLLKYVDCYIDNDMSIWGNAITVSDKTFLIKSPDYLKECQKNTVIILNISRFNAVLEQIESMECTKDMECYIMPMLLIHNYCSNESTGNVTMIKSSLIPKKIHYMWLGREDKTDVLKKCLDSWNRFCPDYEIIEWNEDNYDINKNKYMRQAYSKRSYGFVPDYARLDILFNEGGLYLDTDVEIVRNVDDLLYQEAFCGVEKWQLINFGGMSGAIKGHPMIKKFLDARKDICFVDEDGRLNKNTCGFYDTKVAIDSGYIINGKTQCIEGMNIYAYDFFHPFDYMSGKKNQTKNTFSVHWFNGGWLNTKMLEENESSRRIYDGLYDLALKHNDV